MRQLLVMLFGVVSCGGSATTEPTSPSVTRLAITPDTGQLLPGQTRQLAAAAYGPTGSLVSGPAVTWRVDDQTVASVSTSGLLTAVAPGQVTVTVASGAVTATGSYDVRLLGTYTLRTANRAVVPVVASRDVACPPSATADGTVTVNSGSFRFDPPAPGVPARVQGALDVVEDCGNSSSTYYGSMPARSYALKAGLITFDSDFGYPFREARLSKDTITMNWKPERSDSIEFKFVKQ